MVQCVEESCKSDHMNTSPVKRLTDAPFFKSVAMQCASLVVKNRELICQERDHVSPDWIR